MFLFFILFLGAIFNFKKTNFKEFKEILKKAKDYSKKNN